MSEYRLVIFDYDGTICATKEAIIYCMQEAFRFHNLPIPSVERIFSTITNGIGLEDSFKQIIVETYFMDTSAPVYKEGVNAKAWIETYRELYRENADERCSLFSDAYEVLKKMYQQGMAIVVASNKGVVAIEASLARFDLDKYVSLVVGDTPGIKKKPDPMLYDKIIKQKFSFIHLHEILVVGDTTADLSFAKNIGVDSCWASYGYGLHEACINMKPTYTITSLNDLIEEI